MHHEVSLVQIYNGPEMYGGKDPENIFFKKRAEEFYTESSKIGSIQNVRKNLYAWILTIIFLFLT